MTNEKQLTPKEGEFVRVACGGSMEFTADTPWAIYQGEVVAFCTEGCKRTFDQDPDPFMAGDVPHPAE